MRNTMTIGASAAVLMLAGQLLAGGFFLQLGNPEASAEAQRYHAVVTIKAAGCHDPGAAQLTATAIGMVDGQRKSIPLTLTKLAEPGFFALSQQWPTQGRWVIELKGRNGELFTNTLVAAGPSGVDRLHAKFDMKPFVERDVTAMLEDTTR